ncbi:hypothetical protein GGS23DRAFT_532040 [Durotheca rogersii]|uniref:uncharacterized protein n=1 Tax=Durotheca rogersii TaxID=419775 RepID=UPI00221F6A73|nr:uncharacterized protein GGS23DRAFT_532040 [Durotheca rogersii]KAI5863410.1 hypothetical protein GGS23DRAFT_532040 [Durotheca rogersii]
MDARSRRLYVARSTRVACMSMHACLTFAANAAVVPGLDAVVSGGEAFRIFELPVLSLSLSLSRRRQHSNTDFTIISLSAVVAASFHPSAPLPDLPGSMQF